MSCLHILQTSCKIFPSFSLNKKSTTKKLVLKLQVLHALLGNLLPNLDFYFPRNLVTCSPRFHIFIFLNTLREIWMQTREEFDLNLSMPIFDRNMTIWYMFVHLLFSNNLTINCMCSWVVDVIWWFMLNLLLKWIEKIGYLGVDCKCSVMFVDIILINPYKIITRLLGPPKSLKAYGTCSWFPTKVN